MKSSASWDEQHKFISREMPHLVELESDSPRIILLGLVNELLKSLALWTEPETIVDQLCIPAWVVFDLSIE